MALRTIILLIAGSVASMAIRAIGENLECGAPKPTKKQIAVFKKMALNESLTLTSLSTSTVINISVYVHIVSRNEVEETSMTRNVLSMIIGLNRSYSTMGFWFVLVNVDYTVNADWSISTTNEVAMRKKLRQGGRKSLNLYYIDRVRTPYGYYNGFCNYPTKFTDKTLVLDGCIIQRDHLNNGQTTPHEVGHWLGLQHTFLGGCSVNNDYVADTPACQMSWSCDKNLNTCPEMPGNDPIYNYMGYSSCRREFTDGQRARAQSQYEFYRA